MVRIGSRYERPWHETRGSDGSYSALRAPMTPGDIRVQSALLRRRRRAVTPFGLATAFLWVIILAAFIAALV